MGKRKRTAATDPNSMRVGANDAMFQDLVKTYQTKMQKKGLSVGHNPTLIVLPVPAFIIRYLLQNTGLPLACVYQVVGPQGCYKSTFAIEMLRWHRLCGGYGQLNEAETKPTPELRNSVLNWDQGAVNIEDCASFEDWQRRTTFMTNEFKRYCEKVNGPGRTIPFCIIVDSLTGKASEHTLKNIRKDGHAGMHFPVEAKQMADFLRAYPQELLGWPISFVGVNHMKLNRDPQTGMVDANIPGGWSLKFQCAAIIEMSRIGKIQEFANYKAATVSFNTYKNSYGADNTRINVRFKTWHQEDAPGVWRLHSRFEWWEAGIMFLATGWGLPQAKAQALVSKVKDVCDVREKSGGSRGKLYWSNRLGVASSDAMPAHDLGVMLEQQPEVLSDLYQVLGISQHPYFKPGVDFLSQQEGYAHVQEQAKAVEAAAARTRELMQTQESVGVVEEQYPQTRYDPDLEEL